MTLTELRYIVTLAREQHFGHAAEQCFVSQPTLSIAVKKLEDELGVVIFERSKSSVYPTPLGERIIAQAQLVLEQTATIKEIATLGKDQLNSPLQVGAIFTIGPYLFPRFIPLLQNIAKDMPLYVEESYTATLRQRLRKGELDAIIVSLPFTEADVVTKVLYEEPFVVVMPNNHPLTQKEFIAPDDLDPFNVLLLGEGHCFREQVLEACPHLQPHDTIGHGHVRTASEGSSLETLKHMVVSGLGLSILPVSAALSHSYNPAAFSIRPFVESPMRTVALAWRASYPRLKAIDRLCEAIQGCEKPSLASLQ